MKHLIATEGKASGTKTLLTVVVLAVVARSFLTGVTVGGFHFGDASAAMDHLVELAGVLGLLYGGRRCTDAWREKKPSTETAL